MTQDIQNEWDCPACKEALANKSDWLAKHDASVRRKTLEEVANRFDRMCVHTDIGRELRRMAEQP